MGTGQQITLRRTMGMIMVCYSYQASINPVQTHSEKITQAQLRTLQVLTEGIKSKLI